MAKYGTPVTIRFDDEEIKLIDDLCKMTGWSTSQLFRHLLKNATIRPAAIQTTVDKTEKEIA